jgi:hypothetical protein
MAGTDKIATFYTYRTAAGLWPLNTGTMPGGESAYDYTASIVDCIGREGGYAELFQVDRYPSDFATTGVHWRDVYRIVRMYGERPAHFRDLEQVGR